MTAAKQMILAATLLVAFFIGLGLFWPTKKAPTPCPLAVDSHLDTWFVPRGSGLGPNLTEVKDFVLFNGDVCSTVITTDQAVSGLQCKRASPPQAKP